MCKIGLTSHLLKNRYPEITIHKYGMAYSQRHLGGHFYDVDLRCWVWYVVKIYGFILRQGRKSSLPVEFLELALCDAF